MNSHRVIHTQFDEAQSVNTGDSWHTFHRYELAFNILALRKLDGSFNIQILLREERQAFRKDGSSEKTAAVKVNDSKHIH